MQEGKGNSYAEIARMTGLSRARVTQIVNLVLLAPKYQERLLTIDPHARLTKIEEKQLRRIAALIPWTDEPPRN